jgi:hypothetical protein
MARTITLGVGILDGDEYVDLLIHEDDLPVVTDKDLKSWGISRETTECTRSPTTSPTAPMIGRCRSAAIPRAWTR